MDSSRLMPFLRDYLTSAALWGVLGLSLVAWSALVWWTCQRFLLRSPTDPEEGAPATRGPRPFDW